MSIKGGSRMFQRCFKDVLSMFQGFITDVSSFLFQGCLKSVTRVFKSLTKSAFTFSNFTLLYPQIDLSIEQNLAFHIR